LIDLFVIGPLQQLQAVSYGMGRQTMRERIRTSPVAAACLVSWKRAGTRTRGYAPTGNFRGKFL